MNNYLKNITLLLAAVLLPTIATAHDFEVNGIYYNINGNEATVTHKDAFNSAVYTGDIVIPLSVNFNGFSYQVTSIGSCAFYNCTGLNNIEIPLSITSIQSEAFHNCRDLSSIEIPNSVLSIGTYAFSGCASLTNIKVAPDNPIFDSRNNSNAIIKTSNNQLVIGCKNTIIPPSVTSIASYAFYECNFTNFTIPNTITSIGDHAFGHCSNLTSITIPKSVTFIGNGVFSSCYCLENIDIPNSITSIGTYAFYECKKLKSITIPNSVYSIAMYAFSGCSSITNLIIPNSITNIEAGVFQNCTALENVLIPNSVMSIGFRSYEGCNSLKSVCILNPVTIINSKAFMNCSRLTSITIGNSANSIGDLSFAGCSALAHIYCFASNPPSCNDNAFSNYSATLHVPAASLAAYFTAPCWRNFESIVGDAIAPTEIVISHDSVEMQLGEQLHLIATILPNSATNKEVIWLSTDTNVATVDNGTVTATGYGECDIIASCYGMQAICHISVTNRIALDQQEAMVLPNHMLTLTPSAPDVSNEFSVTSSDPTVAAARVMNGKVQVVGIKEGTTTITVGSTDGTAIPATCLVTVYTEPGDLNCDGFTNISDVTQIIDYLLSGDASNIKLENADVNADGMVNIGDVTALIDKLLSSN